MSSPPPPISSHAPILIIGAGIAGCTLAHALAVRGVAVTLVERAGVAHGASGNPAGVLFPQLGKRRNISTEWHFTAYDFMRRQLAQWHNMGYAFASEACGMVRLPRHAEEEGQFRQLNQLLGIEKDILHWVEADEASAHAGVTLARGGVYFPHGTWVAAGELCAALVTHPNIRLVQGDVQAVTRQDGQWHVALADGQTLSTAQCCLTNAHAAAALMPDVPLRLNSVGGQISTLDAAQVAAPLRSIVCLRGYIIPMGQRYLVGATYNHGEGADAVTDANHVLNLADVETVLPGWVQGAPIAGRTSMRATTPDRLPYAGRVMEGLWISAGHGSRGLLSAPLVAEILAAEITGMAHGLDAALVKAVTPRRFG